MIPDPAADGVAHSILLYDGVCGLCNRLVQFILRRDPGGVFRFVALQSPLAGRILGRHGVDVRDLDTVYIVLDYEGPDERVVGRSDAVISILKELGAPPVLRPARPLRLRSGQAREVIVPSPTQSAQPKPALRFWWVAGFLLQLFPRILRDWAYEVVGRNRYRVFGRYDPCPLPTPETQTRFLDE